MCLPPAFYFYYKTQEVVNHIIVGQINSNLFGKNFSGDTLLGFYLNNPNIKSCFIIAPNFPTDSPVSAEASVIFVTDETNDRVNVIFYTYEGEHVFKRAIYQGQWFTPWTEITAIKHSNLVAIDIEYELLNGWRWTSGTGITRFGNIVTICIALINTELECNEHDKLIEFNAQYAPGPWTEIPALAVDANHTLYPVLLRVDTENGGIVVAVPFKAHHIIINASWIARLW